MIQQHAFDMAHPARSSGVHRGSSRASRASRATGALALLLCACGWAGPALAADRFEDVRQFIREELVRQSVPSISVAVAKDGRILWEEGFGWADREQRRLADEHTMYSLASISKPITGTGLMTLVQAGKIDLDRPANDYLGSAKLRARVGDAREATVRRVANHTSGLPLHAQFFYADEPYARPSMDETILRYGNLIAAPGERYAYSNLGYGILDYIIERVSGQGYADYMRREVFVPLGLTRTSVDIGQGLEAFTATRYGPDGLPIPFYDFDHPGASAVFSSAHDLVRYGMFNLKAHLPDQRAILSDASIDEMHRRTSDGWADSGYSVGFAVRTVGGHRLVEHSGGMGGVSTQMQLFPDEGLAVVVLSNSRNDLPFQVADKVVATLLPGWSGVPRKPWSPPAFVMTPQLLGTWKGTLSTYVGDVPVELRFLPSGDVHAVFADQLPTLVDKPYLEGDVFHGSLNARIGTPDTERQRYTVALSLKLRGEVMNGAAEAMGSDEPRVGNALTHWIELSRQ